MFTSTRYIFESVVMRTKRMNLFYRLCWLSWERHAIYCTHTFLLCGSFPTVCCAFLLQTKHTNNINSLLLLASTIHTQFIHLNSCYDRYKLLNLLHFQAFTVHQWEIESDGLYISNTCSCCIIESTFEKRNSLLEKTSLLEYSIHTRN